MEWQIPSLSATWQLCADTLLVSIMEGQTGGTYKFLHCCVLSFMLTHGGLFRYLRVPARRLNATRWWGAKSDHCFHTSIHWRWNLKSAGRDPGFLLSTTQHHTASLTNDSAASWSWGQFFYYPLLGFQTDWCILDSAWSPYSVPLVQLDSLGDQTSNYSANSQINLISCCD